MAQVTKTVDKTLVKGSEIFIYTFNVSYSELTQPSQHGTLTDFFPNKILYVLPAIGGQIIGITQTPVAGGRNVTFDFGTVTAGTSLSFTIACNFGPGRVDNDSFTNSCDLLADGTVVSIGTAQTVNLVLTPNFALKKSADAAIVDPGQEITWTLTLINNGDAGASISNVVISDVLPTGLTADTSFTPVGNDSSGPYADTTYDGLTGTWTGNTLNFTLPSFRGTVYLIKFKVKVDSNVVPNQLINNTANWTINSLAQIPATAQLRVRSPEDVFTFLKGASRTSYIGGPINYGMSNVNNGTVPLNNYVMRDNIPPQVDITKLNVSSNAAGLPSYSIYITTTASPGTLIPIVTNVSGNTPTTDLTSFIPVGARVLTVELTAPVLNVSGSSHQVGMFGTVNNTATQGMTVINTADAFADGVAVKAAYGTIINGASDLYVQKGIIPTLPAYYPVEEYQFYLTTLTLNTMTIDPVIADLMPNGLIYVVGSEYFVYSDGINQQTFDSREPGFPVPLPTREIINNFGPNGEQLIRWSFNNFTMPQGCGMSVVFTVFIEIGQAQVFENWGYEGNPGNNTFAVYGAVKDTLDIDGDGITDENISAAKVSGIILTTSEFILKKQVKGASDLAFSSSGTTTAGGNITYKVSVTNNQLTQLKDIDIVDILPYVGDTGVILTSTPRGSQFDVYATASVTAEIINILTNVVTPNPDITIQYSTSKDPIRFDELGNPIGTGTWSTTPPLDITTLASIQVTTGPSVILNSYDKLIVTINAVAPVGALVSQVAYNSFAVKANQIDGGTVVPMLPTEPNKVGVRIVGLTNGSIGDFVWADYNGNGIHDTGEPGVNGVTVQLYDANKNLLQTTVTANNTQGQAGYYLFSNLAAGNYYVKFTPYGDYTLTMQTAGGSTPNQTTGFTNLIVLAENQNINTIDAGLLLPPCAYPDINASDKCIHVGTTFDPMAGVTATNCDGVDITNKIIITQNTVNTEVPGIYHVTYSVTDMRNQTTVKTIVVKVCKVDPRDQAITDLIMSVALEQAALTHILNAEGEKIQKIVKESSSIDEILAVNKSVNGMIGAISLLEIVLRSKLGLFDCGLCKNDDCCK